MPENRAASDPFKLPDMGQYYESYADESYMNRLDKKLRETEEGEAIKSSFYYEGPPETILSRGFGTYETEGVTFIKGIPDMSEKAMASGSFDGDTLYFDLSKLSGDAQTISRLRNNYKNNMARLEGLDPQSPPTLGLRFLGLDTPEIPKYHMEVVNKSEETIATVSRETAKKNPNYILDPTSVKKEAQVIKFGDVWQEIVQESPEGDGKVEIRVIHDTGEADTKRRMAGLKAQRILRDIIQKNGGEVYLLLDNVSISRSSDRYPSRFNASRFESGLGRLKYIYQQLLDYNRHRYAGYNLFGQDNYGRYLGTPYIKEAATGRYINLAKYIIAEVPEATVFPDYTGSHMAESNFGYASRMFRLHTYDFRNRILADSAAALAKVFDSRRKIQEWIFGKNFDEMKEWTMTIGDSTMLVPPTSIRVVSSSTTERMPLVRAKGSMAKSSPKTERIVQVSLYFNDEKGINGLPYTDTLPSGKKITYAMNGLRALISQFKFTPFLPVENVYINEVLNIEAVSMVDFEISTLPDYPRCIVANLTLQEFDYRQYMPELPESVDEDGNFTNAFSSTINYDVMRYYYQKPLRLGDELRDIEAGSLEYIEKTYGNKTALQPMKFKDPHINFFMANEVHLQKMLQVKLGMMKSPSEKITLSEVEKKVAKEVGTFYEEMINASEDKALLDRFKLNLGDNNMRVVLSRKKLPIKKDPGKELVYTKDSDLFHLVKVDDKEQYYVEKHEESASHVYEHLFIGLKEIESMRSRINGKLGREFIGSFEFVYGSDLSSVMINNNRDYVKDAKIYIGVKFNLNLPYVTSDAVLEDLRRDASLATQVDNKKMFQTHSIIVPLYGQFRAIHEEGKRATAPDYISKSRDVFRFDFSHPDVKFFAYCHTVTKDLEMNDNELINEETNRLKQGSDLDMLNTLTYDPYEIGPVRITNLSASMHNVTTRFGLNGREGYAPQYMGGQDTVIEATIETMDMRSVGMINAIPRITAQYARDYRLIIPSSPLRIDSEITRLMGVNEVLVEAIDVSTVPGQPGLFRIVMRMISVDRTLRNREALQKVNEFANFGKDEKNDGGAPGVRDFFQLSEALAEAEIYPDLELPTLEELEKLRFDFIRHRLDRRRVYPDPDFYFVYGHVLQSQIFRESVTNLLETEIGSTIWTDDGGESVTTVAEKDKAFSVTSINRAAEKSFKEQEIALKADEKSAELRDPNMILEMDMAKNNAEALKESYDAGSWDIGENISVSFMEKDYFDQLTDYRRAQHSKEISDSTEMGEWLESAIKKHVEASSKIKEYLSTKTPLTKAIKGRSVKAGILYSMSVFKEKEVSEALKGMDGEISGKTEDSLRNILYAAACAKTSKEVYAGNKRSNSWKPNEKKYGVLKSTSKASPYDTESDDEDRLVSLGYILGPFGERMYTRDEILEITGSFPERDDNPDWGVNGEMYFLDPWFRRKETTIKEIEDHKRKIITDHAYAAKVMIRNMLFWISKMTDDSLFPNVTREVTLNMSNQEMNSAISKGSNSRFWGEYADPKETEEVKQYLEFLKESKDPMKAGKLFSAVLMAMTGDMSLYEIMKTRDYETMNAMISEMLDMSGMFEELSEERIVLKKFLHALIAVGEIKESDVGINSINIVRKYRRENTNAIFAEAAEDPNTYIQHSFYDMVVNDKRGRMLRAFPTFYIVFVDEGRKFGVWKLHDNFYNINSIGEIQVAKSRKIAADTCRITMSNMFHTFTTEDEDRQQGFEYDYRDIFDSIFNPGLVARREEMKRIKQQPINRAKLQGGTRIHVRMGYGADASSLPVVFNGTIAEINAGEAVEIVAQGDGIELMNPIINTTEAHERKNEEKFFKWIENLFNLKGTPKEILDAFLTKKDSFWTFQIEKLKFISDVHPLGMQHFGSRDFKQINSSGEITQNIFEGISRPKWSKKESEISSKYASDNPPKISMYTYGKTFWDVLNYCTSLSPDYICGVAPFGFRSTVFHGAPRFYYAYDYYKDENGAIQEMRKPYQQYHIYTSYSDIIKNNIKTSGKDIKTNAVGRYATAKGVGADGDKDVGPLWVDWDIYPEFQKSTVIDTQVLFKEVPIVRGFKEMMKTDTSGDTNAWRATAYFLKESMKDMYTGDLLVVGDPTVKPHDRMFVSDTYEDINGATLVEAVVHQFSAETGFTTSIVPDCISVVDDRHELATQSIASQVVGTSLAMNGVLVAVTGGLAGFKNPLIGLGTSGVAKASKSLVGTVDDIAKIVKMDKMTDALWKMTRNVKSNKAIAGLGGAVATGGGTLLLAAAEYAITAFIGKAVSEAISRSMANKKVLQIFPLKKNQKVMTSGLTGHSGLVYGSPTYNIPGTYDKLYASLDTRTNGFNSVINMAIEFFMTDSIREQVQRYSAIAERGNDESSSIEPSINGISEQIAMRENRNQSMLQRALLVPRYNPGDEEYKVGMSRYLEKEGILETVGMEMNLDIPKKNYFIYRDTAIESLIEERLLRPAWDMNLPENLYETKAMSVNGSLEEIKAIVGSSEGNKVYDIPFLKSEALELLKAIMAKVKDLLPGQDDEIQDGKYISDFATLQSCLRVGDKNTMASTGLSFTIRALGKAASVIEIALKRQEAEIEEAMKAMGAGETRKLFAYRKSPSGGSVYTITVYPPM